MSSRTEKWLLCLGLLVMGMLLAGGSAAATDLQPRNELAVYVQQVSSSSSDASVSQAVVVTDTVSMGDVMSQTSENVPLRTDYFTFMPFVSKWMLDIAGSASASVVWPGQSLVYSITVYNYDVGPATGVVISDAVPVSTTLAGADGTYIYTNGVVGWHDLTVPAGGSLVRHLTVTVPSGVTPGAVVNSNYAVSVPPNPTILQGSPVTVNIPFVFSDDFSNSASGWPIHFYDPALDYCPAPGPWFANYLPGGRYGIGVGCAWNGIVVPAPVRIADTTNFTIEVDARSAQNFMWMSSYGLFFNGSEDLRQMYIVRLFQGLEPPEYAVYRWQNFQGSSNDQPPPIMLTYGTCYSCNGADYTWNHITVRRRGPVFEVYMGASGGTLTRYDVFADDTYMDSNHVRVGVHQGNFEWRFPGDNASYQFDNFKLSPAVR